MDNWRRYNKPLKEEYENYSWGSIAASPKMLCETLLLAEADVAARSKPGFQGWPNGTSWAAAWRAMHVPYRVGLAGNKGLGLFATADIKKGDVIYDGGPTPASQKSWLEIPYGSRDAAISVMGKFSKVVISQLMQWCLEAWEPRDGILCELADEHYINSAENPNIGACSRNFPDNHYLRLGDICALRHIASGEELLENYESLEEDSKISNDFMKLLEAAGIDIHPSASVFQADPQKCEQFSDKW
jgi:hypothetical protein